MMNVVYISGKLTTNVARFKYGVLDPTRGGVESPSEVPSAAG